MRIMGRTPKGNNIISFRMSDDTLARVKVQMEKRHFEDISAYIRFAVDKTLNMDEKKSNLENVSEDEPVYLTKKELIRIIREMLDEKKD